MFRVHRCAGAATSIVAAIALSVGVYAQQSPKLSDEEYARQALAAGPEPVAKGAAVVRPEPDGSMRTIREGTNGFTCLIMGTDRMCADNNSMDFIHAIMHQQPPPDRLGFAYMLTAIPARRARPAARATLAPTRRRKIRIAIGSSPEHMSCCSARRARPWATQKRRIPIQLGRT